MNDDQTLAKRTRPNACAYLAAVVCGSLLVMPGCGIPKLRCALPGPALPDGYSWNNGAAYWSARPAPEPLGAPNDTVQPASLSFDRGGMLPQAGTPFERRVDSEGPTGNAGNDAAASQVDKAAESSSAKDGGGFGGLVRAASLLKLTKADTPAQTAADLDPSVAAEQVGAAGPFSSDPSPGFGDGDTSFYSGLASDDPGTAASDISAQVSHTVFFSDPYLSDLIAQALVGNQELRILAEEIRIASNETYARSGEYRPFVTLGASAGVEKPGRYTREGAVEEQLEVAPGRRFPEPLPDFLVAADVSWELDIWRRLRNAQDAAALRYLATQEGRTYVVTRLVAEIAENYFDLLALDNRLQILNKTIDIQRLSLQIAQAQKAAGRGTELAVQRFEAEVKKNQSEQSIVAQEIVEVENRINFLVGRYPQPVERPNVQFVDLHLNALSAGVPSQLLQNRADIRQAEREVAAAGLDVRVARARFYPSLTLTGGLGWNAFSTGYLFKTPESLIYDVAGELVGPLINRRAIQAAYASANAAQLQRIYEYQRTVLTAHIEVVNYITRVENYRRSIEAKRQQLESLESAVESATQLFQSARAEYLEVLLAQRELMEARMVLIDVKQEQLSAMISAYQALGGGGF